MKVVHLGALAVLFAFAVSNPTPAQVAPMQFGIDVNNATAARSKGFAITYGSLWAGAWNQKYGWGDVEAQLQTAKTNGLTPVIQWWYWGDDISPNCVEYGCTDRYHGVLKTRATWTRLSNELADLINRVMGPASGAVVILETEFNKAGIENYEPFDGYLVEQTAIFHQRNQRVVVGFGNWSRSTWPNFDRAVAAADLLGTQVLYSSVRESNATYLAGAQALIDGAATLQTMFGKPVIVTDFAFSSYPEPAYETYQDVVVREIFARLPELKAAGVRMMIWRMFVDDPNFDTANYHGMAERSWGLLRADGREKAAYFSFLDGMTLDGGSVVTPPSPPPLPPPPAAPTGITATAGNARVTLAWASTANATSYVVKSSTASGGPYTAVASNVTTTSFVHTGLTNGTTYHYVVSAVGEGGESADSPQVAAKPVAPAPTLSIWWPTDRAWVRGLQPFKARLEGYALSSYKMYWKVDGDRENYMYDSWVDAPHKEAMVDVTSWRWRGQGPYAITFVARDNNNVVVAQRTVSIYVK